MSHIRAKVICLFRHQEQVLLAQAYDPTKNEHYLMPIGGGIEFGERAADSIRREVQEEIQQEITQLKYLDVLENIFTFDGKAGHEIVFVYSAVFIDQRMYAQAMIKGIESNGDEYQATWYTQAQLTQLNLPIYSLGIEALLFQS
ncbi:NUDIX domain-containing protein [Acinetobacter sp. SWAC5]|uniref:NUDIX hydrolase n=1 Tax=Acinetobacter sp. SWAC5 TaxID=2293835 RepID=UPI000E343CCF|nr:NUDIX domain-containing protein [Acinetobacter sp. SWAC5]RFS35956.1 NUDIX domain-containing protein [Acinetobacter sp. SWAC5]